MRTMEITSSSEGKITLKDNVTYLFEKIVTKFVIQKNRMGGLLGEVILWYDPVTHDYEEHQINFSNHGTKL